MILHILSLLPLSFPPFYLSLANQELMGVVSCAQQSAEESGASARDRVSSSLCDITNQD